MYSCNACWLAAMAVCLRIGFGAFCVLLFLFSFTTFKICLAIVPSAISVCRYVCGFVQML